MTIDASRGSLESRSVRLFPDTLKALETRASNEGIGTTVLMRQILEQSVEEPVEIVPMGQHVELRPFTETS